MSEQKPSRRSLVSLFVLMIVAVAVYLLLINRQTVFDYIAASQYKPDQAAIAIKDKLNLTHLGSLYFDASATKVEGAQNFNKDCEQQSETNNPILGCYTAYHIFIYDVTNSQLEGIEETTAAHELLHAAYQRLSDTDRATVDKEVEAAYEKVKTPELENRIAYYDKTEPGQKLNELHSILGSEFHNLGTALEDHYREYFNNRAQIVAYYDQYSAVFRGVTTRLTQLSDTINQQTSQTSAMIEQYNKDVQQLNTDVETFNQKNASSGFRTQSEFNTAQKGLLNRQEQLDQTRQSIEASIQSINAMRDTYNQLVAEYNELNKSINSSLSPTPSL